MRWKYVIPALVILALITVFNLFFLNSLLRWGIIAGGEFAFGARVEVASVATRISRLAITVRGLQVADKDAPMRNLFSVDELSFAVEPLPLLSKKIVIDAMTANGIRYGTARKTSGALPPAKKTRIAKSWLGAEGPLAKAAGSAAERAQAKVNSLPALQAIQAAKEQLKTTNIQGLITAENIPMLKDLDEMKAGYQKKAADYQAQVANLKVAETLNAVGPAWNEVQTLKIQNAQDILAAQEKINRLNKSLQDLQTLSRSVGELKAKAEADFGDSKNVLARIEELKNRDLKSVGQLLKLPTFDFSDLTGVILGPVWMERLNKTLGLVAKARTYMPPAKPKAKKSAPAVQPRLRGLDVRFPAANRPPDFWIKRIELSGTTGGEGKPNLPLDFKGTITDVTSDPSLLGRPVKVDLLGAQNARRIAVAAVLDHTGEIPTDRVQVEMSGLRSEEMHLPESEYLPKFQGGQAVIAAGLTLTGDQLAAEMSLSLSGLAKANPEKPANLSDAAGIAAALWAGIDALHLGAKAVGSPDQLDVSIQSDLDKILTERMQKLVGAEITEVQKKLRAEIEKIIAGKQSDLLGSYGADKGGVLGSLAGQQKELMDKIAGIQKLIQEKQDSGKAAANQQTQELQNKAQDQLKGLFGR